MLKRNDSSLLKLISRRRLRDYAGEPSFSRGVHYFEEEKVSDLRLEHDQIQAKVRGTRRYEVEFWKEDGKLGYLCTCPFCQDHGAFCKHCVAVGLAALSSMEALKQSEEIMKGKGKRRTLPQRELTLKEIEEFLGKQEKAKLVSLLVRHAEEDESLKSRLSMLAGKSPSAVHLPTFRKAIDRAVNWGDYIDYHSMHEYVRGIQDVIGSLRELLEENHADEVLELSEHFLRSLEVQMDMVDDSDGYMRGVISDVEELHHQACVGVKPDPEQLARKLFMWGLQSDWEVFYHAAQSYADVLGDRGLNAFLALAEERWKRMRPLKAGEENLEYEKERFRITSIMEQLAAQTGDVEALVAVKAKNLATAYAYLEIAKLYQNAANDTKTLEWAERGLKAFPEGTDSRLREFVAHEYHRRKRHDEAMDLIWAEFADHPGFEEFRLLKSHADQVGGPKTWNTWREKAVQFIRKRNSTDEHEAKRKHVRWHAPDRSTLVKIFLWEKNVDNAWQEAQDGGCHESLWLELAAAREADHPEDAVAVYKSLVEPAVHRMNNQSYHEAAAFVKKVRKLLKRLGREEEWERYLESLRIDHRRKRNFMKLLDVM